MNELCRVALDVQSECEKHRWRFCFIGGLAVQHWGEPRFTRDVDLTLLTGFGNEKAGKEVGALLSELLVQIGEAADLGEEWNELVVRVALVCKTEVHPIGARLVNGDG